MKFVYLILAVVGLVLPYSFFIAFLRANGLDFGLFLKELLAAKISSFFATDLLLSCVVFLRYVRPEAKAISHPPLVALSGRHLDGGALLCSPPVSLSAGGTGGASQSMRFGR